MQRGGDTTYSFCQDASFWYLTGINEPDVLLVMDKGHEYLIVPGRSISREAFDGAINDEELTKVSGIKDIYSEQEGWSKLESRLKRSNTVATLASPGNYRYLWLLYQPCSSRPDR